MQDLHVYPVPAGFSKRILTKVNIMNQLDQAEIIGLVVVGIVVLIIFFILACYLISGTPNQIIKRESIPYCPKCDRTHLITSKGSFCRRCGTRFKFPSRFIFCECGEELLDIYYYKDLFAMSITDTEHFCGTCGKGYNHEDLIERRLDYAAKTS